MLSFTDSIFGMKRMKNKTKSLVITALLGAVITVVSLIQIPIPTGIPLTLQVFAVALTGYVAGGGRGCIATALYIVMGALGLPVFSGHTGGIGALLGPSGGFVLGFLSLALLCGLGKRKKPHTALILGLCGILCCHALGCVWYSFSANIPPVSAFLAVSLPYLLKDIILLAGAYFLSLVMIKRIKMLK